jgi:hypothetical protein
LPPLVQLTNEQAHTVPKHSFPWYRYPRRRLAAPGHRRYRADPANSTWSLHLTRTTRWLTRCLSNVRFREIMMRCVMRRKIGAAIAALLLLSGSSLMSFAQTGGSPSAGQKGVTGSPKAEGIGSTSSTHKPSGSSSSTTGMENRTGTGSGMGTNTSTHNPAGKKD